MKKHFCLSLFILLSTILASCVGANNSQLEATNAALNNQLNSLKTQLTQVGIAPILPTEAPPKTSSNATQPTAIPQASPSPLSAQPSGVIAPSLIYSGSGGITPWTNKTLYPNALFGAANVHMICDPSDTANAKMYIDKEMETATCGAKGEAWSPWKQDITIGDHYIYSSNANDKYEFWTIGSTPFTIHNKYSHSDFIFTLPDPGIYTMKANLIKGQYNVYLTCQQDQNFNYAISQSTSIPIVILSPATCMIVIRDVNQAATSQAEIEVSLEFTR